MKTGARGLQTHAGGSVSRFRLEKKHAGNNFRFNTGNWCSNRKCPSAGKQVGTKVHRESVSDGKTKIGALPAEKPRRSVQLQLRRFRHNIDIILHFLDTVRDRQE